VSSESCAADKCKEQRKKEHKQLYRFLPQTGSSPVPLAFPRRVPLKCNVGLQVAQSHKRETSLLKDTRMRKGFIQGINSIIGVVCTTLLSCAPAHVNHNGDH